MFIFIVLRTSDLLRNTGLLSQGRKRLCVTNAGSGHFLRRQPYVIVLHFARLASN